MKHQQWMLGSETIRANDENIINIYDDALANFQALNERKKTGPVGDWTRACCLPDKITTTKLRHCIVINIYFKNPLKSHLSMWFLAIAQSAGYRDTKLNIASEVETLEMTCLLWWHHNFICSCKIKPYMEEKQVKLSF